MTSWLHRFDFLTLNNKMTNLSIIISKMMPSGEQENLSTRTAFVISPMQTGIIGGRNAAFAESDAIGPRAAAE
jgi:hypothetical protein